MDFIDEQNVSRSQVGENGSQIAGALDRRSSGDLDIHVHFVGQDMSQGGLTQSRRSIEKHMVERLAALSGCLDQNAQVLLDPLLADQIREHLRAERLVQAIFGLRLGVYQAVR